MRRRAVLAGIGTSVGAMAGCTAPLLPGSNDASPAEYRDDDEIVYEHDDLELDLRQETIHLGETIEFEATNTGDSDVSLGCNVPWALQTRLDGDWRHVTWTANRYSQLCYTGLGRGDSHVGTVVLAESELEGHGDELPIDLGPGLYRFVLVGPSPFLAHDFTVLGPG